MSDIQAVSHRGYSARFPENSRLAYEMAIAVGSHIIETDARLTADGKVVSWHDPDFSRITGRTLEISKSNSRDIAGLDIGEGQSPMFLHQVLDLAKGRAGVLVDVKTTDNELIEAIADLVAEAGPDVDVYLGIRAISQLTHVMNYGTAATCIGFAKDYSDILTFFDLGAEAIRAWEEDLDNVHVQNVITGKMPFWVTAGLRSKGEKAGDLTPQRLRKIEQTGARAVLLNNPTLITGVTI